jgi:hypothetical protein
MLTNAVGVAGMDTPVSPERSFHDPTNKFVAAGHRPGAPLTIARSDVAVGRSATTGARCGAREARSTEILRSREALRAAIYESLSSDSEIEIPAFRKLSSHVRRTKGGLRQTAAVPTGSNSLLDVAAAPNSHWRLLAPLSTGLNEQLPTDFCRVGGQSGHVPERVSEVSDRGATDRAMNIVTDDYDGVAIDMCLDMKDEGRFSTPSNCYVDDNLMRQRKGEESKPNEIRMARQSDGKSDRFAALKIENRYFCESRKEVAARISLPVERDSLCRT